jgi:hypothetical protein
LAFRVNLRCYIYSYGLIIKYSDFKITIISKDFSRLSSFIIKTAPYIKKS